MRKLESSKFELPVVFLIEEDELEELPVGVPYIIGNEYDRAVRMLENEVIRRSYAEYLPYLEVEKIIEDDPTRLTLYGSIDFSETLVNVDTLIKLRLVPQFLNDVSEAISTNIQNFTTYNPYLYNKKYDMCVGTIGSGAVQKNLIIIDISGSIPKYVSDTMITLAKTLTHNYYADVIFTGSKSIFISYEDMYKMSGDSIRRSIGLGNEFNDFVDIITGTTREYDNVLSFGDHDAPESYTCLDLHIAMEKLKKSYWTANTLYDFHTSRYRRDAYLTGYGKWIKHSKVIQKDDWVTYFKTY